MAVTNANWYAMSDSAILQVLGNFIKQTRLKQNKTQQALADASGITRVTIVQMERGHGVNMLSFIQVLRALQQLQLLQMFEITPALNPLQLAAMESKSRRRAGRQKTINNKPQSTW